MARGQVLQIASGTNQTISTQSREEKNSFVVYNPNDGVCYFKLNGAAALQPGGYDWKLPAQSAGAFGGPWQSLGIYYLDQSGAGRQGEINLHDSDQQVEIPNIWAIGRSLQAQVTTMDVTEGTIPPNPPAGVARLWVDNNGFFHLLSSTGTDYIITELLADKHWLVGGAQASGVGQRNLLRKNEFGYPAGSGNVYPAVQIGDGQSVSLGVDVGGPTGGNFRGQSELIVPNDWFISQLNAGGTDFLNAVLEVRNGILIPTFGWYWGTGPGSSLTFSGSAFNHGGPSITVPAGRYLVGCWFSAINPGASSVQWYGEVATSGNVQLGQLGTYHSAPANNTDGFGFTMVADLAADTYHVALQSNTGTGTWYANATYLTAMRVGQ